jgi:hypothetical protein
VPLVKLDDSDDSDELDGIELEHAEAENT